MDPSVVMHIVILILLLIGSAFFASAETAFISCNKIRLRVLAEDGDIRAKRVLKITNDNAKMLGALLISNNVVNLSASAIATSLALAFGNGLTVAIATGLLTLVLLVFGEISPKTLATIHADRVAMAYSGMISFIMKLLTPLVFVINKLSMGLLFLFRVDPKAVNNTMTEDELRTIVDVSHETDIIETEEHEMINNVLDFGDAQAKDVMVPRVDVSFANVDSSYEDLLNTFREDHFTRLPVYENSTDNVIGILNMKDLLLYEDREHFNLQNILREPYYTYEHKNTAELLIEMRQSHIHIAIVLDEYGATAGLITFEDLLEEIVGEIRDEYDEDEEDPLQKIGELEYIVQGAFNFQDLCEELNLDLVSEDYDSIGGYLIGLLDHFPTVGESITSPENVYLRVEEMEKNRIHKIFVRLPAPEVEDEEEKGKEKIKSAEKTKSTEKTKLTEKG